MKATVGSGVEVARYIWYNNNVLDGKTTNDEHTTSFACTGSDYDVNVSVQAMSKLGCVNTATLPVHAKLKPTDLRPKTHLKLADGIVITIH